MTERPKASARGRVTSTDVLSEVLRAVRLGGAFFFSVDACGPWAAEALPARELAARLDPVADNVIEFHVITEGRCWVALEGGLPVQADAGDVVVVPMGDAHVMSSAPGMRGRPALDLLEGPGPLPLRLELGAGAGARTHVLCGFLGCDSAPFNPLLGTLPRLLVVRRATGDGGLLEHLTGLVLAEVEARQSGGACVLARLSELMFIEAVRRHLATLAPGNTGWLAGLRDPIVGRALGKLHDRPARDWTLVALAREVGASRSILAERFAQLVGIPPMQYLAQWRIQLAANLLVSTTAGLAEIAQRVGYGSEAALSRAFKRVAGVSPALWRKGRRPPASRPARHLAVGS